MKTATSAPTATSTPTATATPEAGSRAVAAYLARIGNMDPAVRGVDGDPIAMAYNSCGPDARSAGFGKTEGALLLVVGEGTGACSGWLFAENASGWSEGEYWYQSRFLPKAVSRPASNSLQSAVTPYVDTISTRIVTERTSDGTPVVIARGACAQSSPSLGYGFGEGYVMAVVAEGIGACDEWLLVRVADLESVWIRDYSAQSWVGSTPATP